MNRLNNKMFKIALLVFSCLLASCLHAQKPFSGTLEYTASIMRPDTNVVLKSWKVYLYTNDTVVRVETETDQLGVQVYIRNMNLNKAYLLLKLDTMRFAIQTDLSKTNPEAKKSYTIKKGKGKKKVVGLKSQKYVVTEENDDTYSCFFTKKLSGKYLQVYSEIPYLATDYFIPSQNGLIHYELTKIERKQVDRNLFGIPSDFEKISFEEFIKRFYGEK